MNEGETCHYWKALRYGDEGLGECVYPIPNSVRREHAWKSADCDDCLCWKPKEDGECESPKTASEKS